MKRRYETALDDAQHLPIAAITALVSFSPPFVAQCDC